MPSSRLLLALLLPTAASIRLLSPAGRPLALRSWQRGDVLVAASQPPRAGVPSLLAKKKGKGKSKGKGQGKQSGFEWASTFELKPTESAALRELAEQVVSSYRTRTGKVLDASLAASSDVPKGLWSAPVCVQVVHTDEAGEALCTYANLAAVECYGLPASDGYKQLISAPEASLSPTLSGDKKYESGYEKKVAAGAEAVVLRDVERWVIEKMSVVDGKLASEAVGVAYAWRSWTLPDGTTCEPGGVRTAPPEFTPDELVAAADAQAAEVRRLKQEAGLSNSDPAVKAAVAELLRLKAMLADHDG